MIKNVLSFPEKGEYKLGGYAADIVRYTVDNQLIDGDTWKIFVDQFRYHTDDDYGWRGEFWGKMMRGGCLTYRLTKDENLYKALTASVKDMLTVQEKSGRVSARPVTDEFVNWDMWCRKYVLLGCEYYLDICKSEALKRSVIRFMKRHADYILKHVGKGRNKKDILDTSAFWGALNSCSILEPMVRLYGLTGEKRYLDFAEYILDRGCCKDFDLIKTCLDKKLYPYQFPHVKAYEMMSCLEGAVEYYKITGKTEYLQAAQNFVDMVVESDYTIIGCSGCLHELFDNSSVKQTEPVPEVVAQETCVTVTFMKLCAKIMLVTGDLKYIDYIEKSGYNALFGAVNNENQKMDKSEGRYWKGEEGFLFPHEPFPFDSYSPLYMDRRAKRVGGFMVLQNGRSYGCCACIGSAATAIFGLSAVLKGEKGYYVNLYNDGKFKDENISLIVKGNSYTKTAVSITAKSNGKKARLFVRIPYWAEGAEVLVGGEKKQVEVSGGYAEIEGVFDNTKISVKYRTPVKMHVLNGKVAFTKGAITLARDGRLGDVAKPLYMSIKDGKSVRAKVVKNDKFNSNLAVEVFTKDGSVKLCDYSQAGKNYDEDDCIITVWQDVKKA